MKNRLKAKKIKMPQDETDPYLLGKKKFYGLDFFIDKRVLIPRLESEQLVDRILNYTKQKPQRRWSILDVGTGCGCIAVALAKNLPSAKITATDISKDAIEVAQINAKKHRIKDRIHFIQSDLLKSVPGHFDIIVANLPYGKEPTSDYEPRIAIFGGADGLTLYRNFIEQLSKKTWKPKLLVCGYDAPQKEKLKTILLTSLGHVQISFEFNVPVGLEKLYDPTDRMFVVEWPSIDASH